MILFENKPVFDWFPMTDYSTGIPKKKDIGFEYLCAYEQDMISLNKLFECKWIRYYDDYDKTTFYTCLLNKSSKPSLGDIICYNITEKICTIQGCSFRCSSFEEAEYIRLGYVLDNDKDIEVYRKILHNFEYSYIFESLQYHLDDEGINNSIIMYPSGFKITSEDTYIDSYLLDKGFDKDKHNIYHAE